MSTMFKGHGVVYTRDFTSQFGTEATLSVSVLKSRSSKGGDVFPGVRIQFVRDLFPGETVEKDTKRSPHLTDDGRHCSEMSMSFVAFKELLVHITQINMPRGTDAELLQWLEEKQRLAD